MERVVEIGGVPVLFTATDRRRAAALERMLGGAPPSSAEPEIAIHYRVEGPPLPSRSPDARTLQRQLWFDGGDLLALDRSGVCARVAGDEVWVGGSSLDLAGGFKRLFLAVLTHALFPFGRFFLHAGALATDERAVLLLGSSGMGKSTVAFAGLQSGWMVLGDDTTVLRLGTAGPEVLGLESREMAIPSELLTEGRHRAEPLLGDARRRSVLKDVPRHSGWSAVSAVMVVAHGEQTRGHLAQIDGGEVLAELLRACPGVLNPHLLPEIFALAHLLAHGPRFRLAQGGDPHTRQADTRACLDELRTRLESLDGQPSAGDGSGRGGAATLSQSSSRPDN